MTTRNMITRSRAAMNRSKWTLNGAGIYLDSAKKSLAMGRSEVEEAKSLLVDCCVNPVRCQFISYFWAVGAKSLFYKIFVRSVTSSRNRRSVQSIKSEVNSRVSQSP
uniref:Uncharacterized protein n=1 Tax=Ditylenchus dipsaci TaxID=166011 RepID=A0A915EKC4_9BILA